MKRLYVTEETENIIYLWAYELNKKYGIKAKNGKPLHKNFPASLELFVKTCSGHKLNEVFK